MRLAQLSDVHVDDLTGVRWTRFLNKRVTGLVNLIGARRHAHPRHLLEAAVDSIAKDPTIDHVVVTGDLTNLSLESEMAAARKMLEPLGHKLSVIPGNHDVYTRGSERERRFERFFGDWMFGTTASAANAEYPWLKRIPGRAGGPDLVLLGFCSAVARAPLMATGVVSDSQLARLAELAQSPDLTDTNAARVALVHHNMHPRGFRKDKMHGLTNRDAFLDALREAKIPLVLHGHTHTAQRHMLRGVEVIGSGSTTWASRHPDRLGRYNVYTFGPVTNHASPEGARLQHVEVRHFDPDRKTFAATA